MNISPKNIEQECAIDALLAAQVNVVALTGRAGTGRPCSLLLPAELL